jgi:hypothetical protein
LHFTASTGAVLLREEERFNQGESCGLRLQQVIPGAHTLPPQSASVLQGWPQLHLQVRKPKPAGDLPAGWKDPATNTLLKERSG